MRLGEMLIERRLIAAEDLDKALGMQRESGEKLGKILVDLGFVAMRDVLAALSDQLSVPLVSVEARKRAEELARRAEHVELSQDADFLAVFADSMIFPEK